jgi:phosphoserine phosphatase RsbU/P
MAPASTSQEQRIAALEQELAALRRQQQRGHAALSLLHNISLVGRSAPSFRAIFEATYRELAAVFALDACYIAICDSVSPTRFRAVLMVDEGEFEYQEDVEFGVLTGHLVRQRESLLFADLVVEGERFGVVPQRFGQLEKASRAWLGVPLLVGQHAVGVISIQSYTPSRYDADDRDLLERLGNLVGIALENVSLAQQQTQLSDALSQQVADRTVENARLVDQQQRQIAELRTLSAALEHQAQRLRLVNTIALVLSRHLDQQEVLDLAARELVGLFWADHTGTVLFDEQAGYGVCVAEYPPTEAVGWRIPLHNNLLHEELARSRRPVCIGATATDPRAAASREAFERLGIVSLMVVPLLSRGRLIGSISLDSIGRPREFTDEEQELFMTVAAAIAAAVENARLFSAEQSARQTADTLREVARVIGASLDAEEVLALILRELQRVIPYDSASIMLLDGEMLRVAAMRRTEGLPEQHSVVFHLDGQNGAAIAVRERRPVVIADTHESPVWRGDVAAYVRSWLGAPLIARDTVLGVLNINACTPGRFSDADVETARAFASQAAVALENARLYQESVTRVEQELEIARQIQSNLFPRALPRLPGLALAAECLPARETGGDFYDFVVLGERRLAIMVGDASGKSIPGAMLMAVARSIARSEARDHETPAQVMWETNRWIADDVPPGSFVAFCYATLDTQQRRLALANAGQLSPLRRHPDGAVSYLESPGARLPLGIAADLPYAALEVDLEPGDTLVFYTDGVVEAHSPAGELFGFGRLEALVAAHGALAPQALVARVLAEVTAFAGERSQHDDMTLVVLRVD